MTSTDPAVPARCTCGHFENEHLRQVAEPLNPHLEDSTTGCAACGCERFTARGRYEQARRRAAVEPRAGETLPEQIAGRVLAIRDRAAEAGRIVSTEEQQDLDAQRRARELSASRATEARVALEVIESIPTRFRSAGITNTDVGRWAGQVAAGDTTDSLILLGGVGTGKTTEAFAAWSYVIRHTRQRGEWTTVPDLLEGMRPGRPERVDFTTLQRTRLLLLDDLAAERESEWTAEILYRLLDYRYAWELPTIITSNVPPGEVRAKLGDRIASRLNGMGRTVILGGPDRRTPGQG